MSTPRSDAILTAALDCLLWVGVDEHERPLDATYSRHDILEADVDKLRDMLEAFAGSNAADLEGLEAGAIGHDFILTANGHGAGFWDRGLGERGDRLTAACKPYGSISAVEVGAGRLAIEGV